MSTRYRVLAGLPAYGPPADAFTAHGGGTHRQGLVVEFTLSSGDMWVGNFQPGVTRFDVVLPCPRSQRIMVVAGGQAYVVEPELRASLRTFGGTLERAFEVSGRLVFSDGLMLEAIDGDGVVWTTRRLSWDGLRDVHVEDGKIFGKGYDLRDDAWRDFVVDVETGDALGGSFPSELYS